MAWIKSIKIRDTPTTVNAFKNNFDMISESMSAVDGHDDL
jgi:hypothetical protein